MSEKDGGSAFPNRSAERGMSLRDCLASQVMIVMLTSDLLLRNADDAAEKQDVELSTVIAHASYRYADAMLKERAK